MTLINKAERGGVRDLSQITPDLQIAWFIMVIKEAFLIRQDQIAPTGQIGSTADLKVPLNSLNGYETFVRESEEGEQKKVCGCGF